MQISLGTLGRIAAITTCLIAGSHATARADLSACGEVDVQANAQCVVVPPSAQCQTMCTPISVKAACSAQLAVDCDAQCSKLPSVDCYGSCEAGCVADCTVDPGKFECAVDCRADCSGHCAASCSAKSDKSGCMASCSGACSVGCDKQCNVQPPSATCDARCKASCQGSCKVDTNVDCQVDCQAKGYAKCEAEVTGGCKARCTSTKGALFCDGNFVDTGDKLQECVDALKAVLDVKVTASSSGSSDCAGGTCNAQGEAGVSSSCSVAHLGSAHTPRASLYGLASLLVLGLFMRRRRAA
jgi:hypothetical protein